MKIVVAHGCWPHVERMLAVAMRCPNVYLVPDCYVYIDCMPFADTYIEAANSSSKYRTIFGQHLSRTQPEADHRRLEEAPVGPGSP